MKRIDVTKSKNQKKDNTKKCWSCGSPCWRSDVHYCWDCYKYQNFESK